MREEWLEILNKAYKEDSEYETHPDSKKEWLVSTIFQCGSYSSEVDEKICDIFVSVCFAITKKETFEYVEDFERYVNYTMVANSSFMFNMLDWGTSLRGAWWTHDELVIESKLKSICLFLGQENQDKSRESFEALTIAMHDFIGE